MIAKLNGVVDGLEEDNLTIDINGVGYLVGVPASLSSTLKLGDSISLYIQTIVKEDAINLYGFKDLSQRKAFNLLLEVQGVGAKIALLMLSKLSIEDLQKAIMFEDINTLKSVNGVGIKVAQRIINELKGKVLKVLNIPEKFPYIAGSIGNTNGGVNFNEAAVVLEGLGYSKFEINKVIEKVRVTIMEDSSTEAVIKECLHYIAKGLS